MKKAKTLTSVNMVKMNGNWKRQEEMDQEEFFKTIEKAMERGIESIGFLRVKKTVE